MSTSRKLLIVDVAAFGWELAAKRPPPGLMLHRASTVFPALTCTAQASFRTAEPAAEHGVVGNGLFFRDLRKVLFWEQASSLVAGPRIWARARARGRKVGIMFWQQSLGEAADLVVSPRPIHLHRGGMVQDCYTRPHDLYDRLVEKVGRRFNLMHYWGPLASRRSSEWIAEATAAVMASPDLAPDVLLSYLPHLDYDLQRHGPGSRPAERATDVLHGLLVKLVRAAEANGYDYLFFGDYAIGAVDRPAVFPNRALREAGLFLTRAVRGMAYPDFFASPAFAMVDHEVAHVFAADETAARRAREVLAGVPGIGTILGRTELAGLGAAHARAGELVLVAEPGAWFAYPWWTERREAPDYATHIDIHNKPGYDPCELFFGWPPLSVSLDPARVRGSHGRPGPERDIAWTTSCAFDWQPKTLVDLARATREWIDRTIAAG